MKVDQFVNDNNRAVANQFIIHEDNGNVAFQSYNTIIAIKTYDGRIVLDSNNWNYSNTTGKYRNKFLRETKKETERKIKLGIYKLADLNHSYSDNAN